MTGKVDHVSRARQDRRHTCHWPGCEAQVPPAMWGCKPHWFKLPKALRDKVWDAYVPGQEQRMDPSAEYLAVAHEVQAWIAAHYPPPPTASFAVGDKVLVIDEGLADLRRIMREATGAEPAPNHHGVVQEVGDADNWMTILFDDGVCAPYPVAEVRHRTEPAEPSTTTVVTP